MIAQFFLESPIAPHDSALYAPGATDVASLPAHAQGRALRDAYERDGYVRVRGALTGEEVAAAREELRFMTLAEDPRCRSVFLEAGIRAHLADGGGDGDGGGGRLSGEAGERLRALAPERRARFVRKFMGFTAAHTPLGAIARKASLLALVTRLAGGPVRLFQEMALIKPPGGREKPWHQDHAYFNLATDARVVGVWIPLDQATIANGCMRVLAGAHREGPRPHVQHRDRQIPDAAILGRVMTALPMEAGDVLLFHSLLPHGTPVNQTEATRWAMQLHFAPRSAREVDEQVRLKAFSEAPA